jgi:hypothetical protein
MSLVTYDANGAEKRIWNDTELVLGGDTRIYRQFADVIGLDDQLRIPPTGTTPATTNAPKALRIGSTLGSHLQSGWDGNAHTALFHNAYFEPGAVGVSPKWVGSHASFGSRGILFNYASGISFYADAAASTADAAFTPTQRMIVGNDGKVTVVAGGNKDQLSLSSTAFNTGLTLGASAGDGVNLYRSALGVLKTDARLEANQPAVRCYLAADQSVPNNTGSFIAWTAENYDNGGLHDTATNNGRITFQAAGIYRIEAFVLWAAGTTGQRIATLQLNGTTTLSSVQVPATGALSTLGQYLATTVAVNVGDFVIVNVQHTQGAALNVVSGAGGSWMAATYERP